MIYYNDYIFSRFKLIQYCPIGRIVVPLMCQVAYRGFFKS